MASRILADYAAACLEGTHAVLYRLNAQSNQLDAGFKRTASPTASSGQPFFDRAEVKDMLAYLCVLAKPGGHQRLVRTSTRRPGESEPKRCRGAREIAARAGPPSGDIKKAPDIRS